MKEVASILVIVDKPKHPQVALERAKVMQQETGAKLALTAFAWHSLAEDSDIAEGPEAVELKSEILAERSRWLEDRRLELGLADDAVSTEVVWTEDIAGWVAETTRRDGFDLVLKSVHHSRTLLHTPLDWHLIRSCPVPLLLASNKKPPTTHNVVASLDLRHSDAAHQTLNLRVLDAANWYAENFGGEIHCVYSVEFSKVLRDLDVIDVRKMQRKAAARAKDLLNALLKPYNVPSEHVHMPAGKVGRAVNGVVRKVKADLLVVGTTARTGVGAALLGNSAEKILAKAVSDLLIVNLDE